MIGIPWIDSLIMRVNIAETRSNDAVILRRELAVHDDPDVQDRNERQRDERQLHIQQEQRADEWPRCR